MQANKVEKLTISGAYVYISPVFGDDRGYFTEVYHVLKVPENPVWPQVSLSLSKKKVVRGLHRSPYQKVVKCTSGALVDVIVDLRPESPTFLKIDMIPLKAGDGKQVNVPAYCGHGFVSLEDNTVMLYCQGNAWTGNTDIEVNCYDPEINVPWEKYFPRDECIVSNKDLTNPSLADVRARLEVPKPGRPLFAPPACDFALMGHDGFIGGAFLEGLKAGGYSVNIVKGMNLANRESLRAELYCMRPKYGLICAAGLRGTPNAKWCDTHQIETVDINITGQLNVVHACMDIGMHVSLVGSGMLYKYDDEHKSGSGVGYTEEDEPNFINMFYVEARVLLEKLLASYYKEGAKVLNLRVLFPISSKDNPGNLLTKLRKFATVNDVTTSITVLDDLVPAAVKMAMDERTGTVNFANPGTISYNDILAIYRDKVDGSFKWNSGVPVEGGCELDPSKLLRFVPGVRNVRGAIEAVCENMAKQK